MKTSLTVLLAALLVGCGSGSSPTHAGSPAAPPTPSKEAPVAATPLPDFDADWNFGDPAGTRAAFEAHLASQESGEASALGLWRLELRTQIARTHSLAHEFDAAHALLDAVDAELAPRAADPSTARVRIRSLLERGRTWNSAGDKGKARPPFERAWALGREAGDDGLSVDAAHMVAIAAMGTDDELPWGEKALELALASSDPKARSWRGSLLNNIGWTFHDRGDFPRALALFDEQIAVRRADAKEPALRIARWTRARCLRSLGKHELALSELRTLVDEYGAEATGDGFVHEEIAENLLALGRADEARPAFAEAHTRLASSWVNDEEPERVARLKQLGTAPDR
jgi:tetratricopeptide (TPR) repeat protein